MVASLAVMVGWADCGRVQLAELVDDRPGLEERDVERRARGGGTGPMCPPAGRDGTAATTG